MPHDRIGFYCELPSKTIAEIRRRAKKHGVSHWQVIVESLAPARIPPASMGAEQVNAIWREICRSAEADDRARHYASSPNFTAQYAALCQSQPKTKKDHGRKHTSRRR